MKDIKKLTVGLIGGTGEEGRGLALRWARAGARVTIGSRLLERAKSAADELNALAPGTYIRFAENKTAISGADLVLLTVPFQHAAATLKNHLKDFEPGSVLVDITVPVSFEKGRASYVELPEGSASEHLKSLLPDSIDIVAAFKTIPAHLLVDPNASLDCDVFVAGDSAEVKAAVIEAIGALEGVRAVDAGRLSSARTLERMTVLAIGINRRYKVKTARYRVVGL